MSSHCEECNENRPLIEKLESENTRLKCFMCEALEQELEAEQEKSERLRKALESIAYGNDPAYVRLIAKAALEGK